MVKATAQEVPTTESRTIGPLEGANGIFAGWDMFYWMFGARASEIQVVPEGVVLINLRFNEGTNVDQLLAHTLRVSHRLDLPTCYPWLSSPPEKPLNSLAISVWQSQWFGGAEGGGNKAVPEYISEVTKAYRSENGILGRGQTGPGILKIDTNNFDPEILEGLPPDKIAAFQAAIDAANAKRSQPVGA